MKVQFKTDMRGLKKSIRRLGTVPQKYVTQSARRGMNIPLNKARQEAPVEQGDLKKAMKLTGERSRYKAKKVYRIAFNKSYNDVFQSEKGYYPYSMEYGYHTKDGVYHDHSDETGWMVGFIRNSFNDNIPQIERTIVAEMKKRIDTAIAEEGL